MDIEKLDELIKKNLYYMPQVVEWLVINKIPFTFDGFKIVCKAKHNKVFTDCWYSNTTNLVFYHGEIEVSIRDVYKQFWNIK